MNTSIKSSSRQMPRRINGQGMTEYIIIVALIALSAVVVVGLFGDVVKTQFAGMAEVLAGEAKSGDVAAIAEDAATASETASSLSTFGD